jgi:hypothetical protein
MTINAAPAIVVIAGWSSKNRTCQIIAKMTWR